MPALKAERSGVLHGKSSPSALRAPPHAPSLHYGARRGRRRAGAWLLRDCSYNCFYWNPTVDKPLIVNHCALPAYQQLGALMRAIHIFEYSRERAPTLNCFP